MSETLKEFDIVKIIGVDEPDLNLYWVETPLDDIFRKGMKSLFSYAGSIAMCVVKNGYLLPIIGHLPYSAWWSDKANYVLLGNVKDGYVIKKDEMQKEYDVIQKYISDCIDEANFFTFDPFHFAEQIKRKIQATKI